MSVSGASVLLEVCACVCVRVCMCVHMYVCTYMCVCVCMVKTFETHSLDNFEICNTLLLTTLNMLSNRPQNISPIKLKLYTLWPNFPIPPNLYPLIANTVLFDSMNSIILGSICNGDHMVISHSIVYPCYYKLHKIPSFCKDEYYSIVYICHTFFIHSPTDGHFS
jgi:hypothetical protein